MAPFWRAALQGSVCESHDIVCFLGFSVEEFIAAIGDLVQQVRDLESLSA